jgi:hypothetical protein
VLTVVALLGAAMLAAAFSDITIGRGPTAQPSPVEGGQAPDQASEPPPPTAGGPEQPQRELPAWLGYVLAGLCIAVVVGFVVALLWSVLRDRLAEHLRVPAAADPEELRRRTRERVRAAVDAGLSDLDIADADPRRAVIACWARLEAAAAAAGTPREPGDTSTELVERLLADHAITEVMLANFAAIYREARFAPHVVDESMRDQARAALRQVRDELTAEVDASTERSIEVHHTHHAGADRREAGA